MILKVYLKIFCSFYNKIKAFLQAILFYRLYIFCAMVFVSWWILVCPR